MRLDATEKSFIGWTIVGALLIVVGLLAGCAASARQKAITSTLLAIDAACSGYRTYEHAKAEEIIKAARAARDIPSGEAALAKLRTAGDKALLACDSAYRADAVAAQLDDDKSLASLLAAASIVYDEIKALGIKIPGVSP